MEFWERCMDRLRSWRTIVLCVDIVLVLVGSGLLWTNTDELFPTAPHSFRSGYNYIIVCFFITVLLNLLAFILDSPIFSLAAFGLLFSYSSDELFHTNEARIMVSDYTGTTPLEVKQIFAGFVLIWIAVFSSFLTFNFTHRRPIPVAKPYPLFVIVVLVLDLVGIILLLSHTHDHSPVLGYWDTFMPAIYGLIIFGVAVYFGLTKWMLIAAFLAGYLHTVLFHAIFVSKGSREDHRHRTPAYSLIWISQVLILGLLGYLYHRRVAHLSEERGGYTTVGQPHP